MEGYLEKYSGGKQGTGSRLRRFSVGIGNMVAKWDRRYFVLRDSSAVLAYHKTAEDAQTASKPALGTATCTGSTVSMDKDDGAVFYLTVKNDTSQRVLWLRAADSTAARKGVGAIVKAGATEVTAAEASAPSSSADGSLQGMLLKQNKGKFEKRYFALRESTLSYYCLLYTSPSPRDS